MDNQTLNWAAIELAVLRELQRQGVAFGHITIRHNYPSETHLIVETYRADQLDPKYIETTRISSAIERVQATQPPQLLSAETPATRPDAAPLSEASIESMESALDEGDYP